MEVGLVGGRQERAADEAPPDDGTELQRADAGAHVHQAHARAGGRLAQRQRRQHRPRRRARRRGDGCRRDGAARAPQLRRVDHARYGDGGLAGGPALGDDHARRRRADARRLGRPPRAHLRVGGADEPVVAR
eukprot:2284633-Prymnesium_polylepis.1